MSKFTDLFFREETQQGTQQVVQTAPQVQEQPQIQQVISDAPSGIASDNTIVAKIWEEIKANNLPGPDYLELKQNYIALKSLPVDDSMKLISAYNILKANYPTFSKDIIIRSIDTYIGIVNKEKEEGLREVQKMREENKMKESGIDELKRKADEIKAQYDSIISKIQEETASVATEKIAIDNKERTFTASVDTVINTLNSDKTQINSLNI